MFMSQVGFLWTVSLLVGAALPVAAQDTVMAFGQTSMRAAPAGADLLATPARLSVENMPLNEALVELRRTSGVSLAFSPSLLPKDRAVTCGCTDVTLKTALDRMLDGTSLRYAEWGGRVLLEAAGTGAGSAKARTSPAVALAGVVLDPRLPARHSVEVRQGTVTGVVVDARSMRPLAGAQIDIAAHQIGTVTNSAGRFLLPNVPAGPVTVRAQLIGYATMQHTVTVPPDGSVAVNFDLVQEALALDEVVVTGTAGGSQRRALGNVVERLDAASLVETTPATDFQQLLGQRNPGVAVMPSSGQVGGVGGAIRIRGISSITQSNSPMIYVDGVRVDGGFSGPATREGRNVSRINDLNPEDIESIEVIKGPAAATLYGTEASGGVIQIITKRGSEGAPRFDFTVRQGTNWLQRPAERLGNFYDYNRQTGELRSFNLYEHEKENGLGPIFQYGHLQSYTASVTGGTANSRYYISTDWEDNEGIVSYNWQKRLSTRANLGVTPHESLGIDVNMGYVRGTTSLMQQSSGWDIWSNLLWGSPRQLGDDRLRGFLRATPEAIAEIEALTRINRFTGGITLNHRPTSWLAQRAVLGLDVSDEVNSTYFPRHPEGANWFFGARSRGEKTVERPRTTVQTVDYSATATLPLASNLTSATSFGFQYYRTQTEEYGAMGREFPVPGLSTVGAGAVTQGSEDFVENATVGIFIQQQLDWANRIFVTGAVRGDDNSAFGADFDAAIYPKLSATWVIHEEAFWNLESVSSFRVRSAWGAAGQQPAVFAAARLYDATTGPGDGPVVTPGSFGNPQLKPERGEELELGFDAGVLSDRVNLAFTYYNRSTKDAILNVPLPPSVGFPGSQVVNLGETRNWGTEWALDARLLDR